MKFAFLREVCYDDARLWQYQRGAWALLTNYIFVSLFAIIAILFPIIVLAFIVRPQKPNPVKSSIARQSGRMRVTVNGFRERIERIGAPHVTSSVQSVRKIR